MSLEGELLGNRNGDVRADPVQPVAHLRIGQVLASMGAEHDPPISLEDIHLIRHGYNPEGHQGLRGLQDLTDERVLRYTREQSLSTRRFPAQPPTYWVVLVPDGGRRSRFFGTFENRGEVVAERTETVRYFDLRPSDFLASLRDRLVIDWSSPRNWHRRATSAAGLPVLEIADRDTVPFPGFDHVLLTHHELREMIESHRYADWRAAMREVQGIYLITDTTSGQCYVGKADGGERLFGRWAAYARTGDGGNVALRELLNASGHPNRLDHARHFQFSILRVFGPSTSPTEVNDAESHYKRALMTRTFGLNRN